MLTRKPIVLSIVHSARKASFMLGFLLFAGCFYFPSGAIARPGMARKSNNKWVCTWGTARQLVEPGNMPTPGLGHSTLRQIVCVSIGGKNLRLKLSNEFGNSPLVITSVTLANSTGGGHVDGVTSRALMFNSHRDMIIAPGTELTTDAMAYDLQPRAEIAVTITFGNVPEKVTGHPGSRTTSYFVPGDHLADTDLPMAVKTDHWYFITGIDVEAKSNAGTAVVFGDSITDGRGSGTNKQNRWPDILAVNLQKSLPEKQIGIVNMGIGGNAVIKGGLGPNGKDRFAHDVLQQSGVKWLIILEGVNDIGAARDSLEAIAVATSLIAAFNQMIINAHNSGIKVYGATIMPFKKNGYYRTYRDKARNIVNDWIRAHSGFDAVIDFDQLMRNPAAPDTLLAAYQEGANDYLHPNEYGYRVMGESVDLNLFSN